MKTQGREQKARILTEIKYSEGLTVDEMKERLGLSYMGVKTHCAELAKQGMLDTWRRPKAEGMGRPEMVYRLTRKSHSYFPSSANFLTMDLLHAARQISGPQFPEKLLFRLFKNRADQWHTKFAGLTFDQRVKKWSRTRNDEGCMGELYSEEENRRFTWIEYHTPLFELFDAFPILHRLEQDLFESVLEASVVRTFFSQGGQFQARYEISSRQKI